MDLNQAKAHMRAAVKKSGRTYAAWAAEIGVSCSFLSAAINGDKAPSPTVLAAFGLERTERTITTYQRKRP